MTWKRNKSGSTHVLPSVHWPSSSLPLLPPKSPSAAAVVVVAAVTAGVRCVDVVTPSVGAADGGAVGSRVACTRETEAVPLESVTEAAPNPTRTYPTPRPKPKARLSMPMLMLP